MILFLFGVFASLYFLALADDDAQRALALTEEIFQRLVLPEIFIADSLAGLLEHSPGVLKRKALATKKEALRIRTMIDDGTLDASMYQLSAFDGEIFAMAIRARRDPSLCENTSLVPKWEKWSNCIKNMLHMILA